MVYYCLILGLRIVIWEFELGDKLCLLLQQLYFKHKDFTILREALDYECGRGVHLLDRRLRSLKF
jgi:hypothetical protein